MDYKTNIDLSELKSMRFPGAQNNHDNVTSKDVLKNFAKRVDGIILEDDAIDEYFGLTVPLCRLKPANVSAELGH
jgi:hypothetical protein